MVSLRIIGCWLGLAVLCAGAEVEFILPDPWVVGVEQAAELRVSGPRTVVAVDPPSAEGVRWGRARGQRSSFVVVGGAASQRMSWELPVVAERAPGALTLSAGSIRFADGSTASLVVRPVTLVPPDPRLAGDGFAEARFEPAEVVPGQATTLVLRVAVRARQDLSPGLAPPADAIRLGDPESSQGTAVGVDGATWAVTTWRWSLAFPAPASATAAGQQAILVPVGRPDIFGNQQGVSRQLPIRPAVVTVRPLPATGRPADYTGLVGEIRVGAALDRDRIALGEGARLTVTIHGSQLDLLRPPAFSPPTGLQAYARAPETADGARIFSWDLVPVQAGQIALPPISVPWFDPASGAYRRSGGETLVLTVIPGRPRELVTGGARMPEPLSSITAGPAMPPPVGDGGGWWPHPVWSVSGALVGLLITVSGCLLAKRSPRRIHRGQALAAALANGDAEGIAAAAAALAGADLDAAARTRLDGLRTALDRHRFGGVPLTSLDVRGLEDIP